MNTFSTKDDAVTERTITNDIYEDDVSVYSRRALRTDVTGHQHHLSTTSPQLISDYFDLLQFEISYFLAYQNFYFL